MVGHWNQSRRGGGEPLAPLKYSQGAWMEIPGGALLPGFAALLCRQVVPLYSWLINGPTSSIGAPSFRQLKPLKTHAGKAAHKNVRKQTLFKLVKDERWEAQPKSPDSAEQWFYFLQFYHYYLKWKEISPGWSHLIPFNFTSHGAARILLTAFLDFTA